MILAPNLNLFGDDAILLKNFSQAAKKGVNAFNILFAAFTTKKIIPKSFIFPRINLCILPL